MRQLILKPALYRYDNCKDFVRDFEIGGDDLILADRSIFSPYFGELAIQSEVLFQTGNGNGGSLKTVSGKIASGLAPGCTRIIGIGDGEVMDMARLLSLRNGLVPSDSDAENVAPAKKRELILVPTTCGISGELTTPSLLELANGNAGLAAAIDTAYADSAVMIPQLVEGLSYNLFIAGAADALVHAAEAAVSPRSTVSARLFAFKAVDTLVAGMQTIAANGEMARMAVLGDFLDASNYANIAYENAGAGAVHALSAPLRERYHVLHGEANRIFFVPVLEAYAAKKSDGPFSALTNTLSKSLGCGGGEVHAALEKLLCAVSPRRRLREYGVLPGELEKFTREALSTQTKYMENACVGMEADDVYSFLGIYFTNTPPMGSFGAWLTILEK